MTWRSKYTYCGEDPVEPPNPSAPAWFLIAKMRDKAGDREGAAHARATARMIRANNAALRARKRIRTALLVTRYASRGRL